MLKSKADIVSQLQAEINSMQGYRPAGAVARRMGLGPIEAAFPGGVFPEAGVHEFITTCRENSAASEGFVAALLGQLVNKEGITLWISLSHVIFPPALRSFGISPDKVVFINAQRVKDVLWTTEEALKSEGVSAVVSEIRDLGFTESLRLQHAVEKSKVTGFILRKSPRDVAATASCARWRVQPQPSTIIAGVPGIGHRCWSVELEKVRNGHPGKWIFEWSDHGLRHIPAKSDVIIQETRNVG